MECYKKLVADIMHAGHFDGEFDVCVHLKSCDECSCMILICVLVVRILKIEGIWHEEFWIGKGDS